MGKPPTRGAKVRLLHDFKTRGNKTYRKGLVMQIGTTHGEYVLYVWVRCKKHWIRVKKNQAKWTFEVIQPGKQDDDADSTDQGSV
jgi:hypothetical protein